MPLEPDRCGPVMPLATTSLDFTPLPLILHASVEGKLINLCMSYRLEMKFFFILKIVGFTCGGYGVPGKNHRPIDSH
jgi:hypothetical protein